MEPEVLRDQPLPPQPAQPRPEEKPAKVVSPSTVVTVLSYLAMLLPWVKRQPKWLKILLGIPFIIVATFYFRDQRIGNGIFAGKPAWTADLGQGVTAYPLKTGRTMIVYGNGTEQPADGYGVLVVTADDEIGKKTLEATSTTFDAASFPLVVFFNTSGFDESGLPTVVRQASDGAEKWRLKDVTFVRLLVPQKDGNYKVYTDTGEKSLTPAALAAEITRTPPEPVHGPPEFEKLTDEELKAKGYERLSVDEYEKRYGRKPPLVRPLTLPPAGDKK